MKTKFNGILTLLLALTVQFVFAQKTVSGTVSDDMGPLAGVNVVIKGTQTGSETDFDGKYSLQAKQGDVLLFSYIGMITVEKTVGVSNNINVLMSSSNLLEEVVIVAYGSQKREAIVGSIVSLDAEKISKQQVTSVTSAIQGNVAGVNIITSGGVPGTNPVIRVRGVGSINASAEPLVIVDGAPYNGNINAISQDQIETISVLKDASSTSLYGSRGANGVILITTKKGKINTVPALEFSSSYGFSKNAVDFHKVIGAADYMKYSWEALRNTRVYTNGNDAITAGQFASTNLITNLAYNPYNVANPIDASGNLVQGANLMWDTNWNDYLLRNSGARNEQGLQVSGGGENTTYIASLNYLSEDGNVQTTNFERITARVRMDSKINNWIAMGGNIGYSDSNSNVPTQAGSSFTNVTQWFYSIPNIYPVYRRDANGNFVLNSNGEKIYDYGNNSQTVNGNRPIFSGENGVGSLYNYDQKYNRINTSLSGYLELNLTKNLKFKSNLSHERYTFDSYAYSHRDFGNAANVDGRVAQERNFTTTLNAIQQLNFKKSFNNHNLNLDAIYEAYKTKYDYFQAQGVGFLPDVFVLNGSTTPEDVGGYFNDTRINSYVGRAAYNYNDKYFIEGSLRRDGSTQFAKAVRWGNFYSVGGSWIVSKENFLANSKFINFLKLKASYGELGNVGGIGSFPYIGNFDVGWNNLDNPGILLSGVVDENLTWEKSALLNAGIDFKLLNNRLSGTVEYYERNSVDLIYNVPLPLSTGDDGVLTNAASLKNSGIEVTLDGSIINKEDLNWEAGFNFSLDKNEITDLPQAEFLSGTKLWRVGKSLYDFYTYDFAGVDPSDGYALWYMYFNDMNENNVFDTGDVKIGNYVKYLEDNPDATIGKTTTKTYTDASRNYVGKSSLPDVIGGFNTSVGYKNWDLTAFANFSFGGYIMDGTYQGLMNSLESFGNQLHSDIENRWQKPGDITDVPLLINTNNDFNSTSTRFLFKNDYIRLKAINLGYNFESDVLEKMRIKGLRIYLQGDNLFTYQSHKGIDPEQDLAGTTNSRSYQLKSVSFGVKAKF